MGESVSGSNQLNIILKSIMENSEHVVIFALDSEYRYVVFNKNHSETMRNIWGRDIALGHNILDYINDPEDRVKAQKNFDRVLAGESFNVFEEYGDTEIERRLYDNVYNPIKDDKGNIIGISVILSDITEEEKAKKALEKSEANLKESNKLKDKFFKIIAHDLIGPIGSVNELTNLLNDSFDEFSIDEQKKYLNTVAKGVQNIYKLLNNLLTWASLQRDEVMVDFQIINLFETSNEIVEMLRQSCDNKSITLNNQIPEEINIETDKNILLTVIRNLLSNAIKFTPQKGIINLSAEIKKSKNNKPVVEVSVNDNGVGISQNIRSKLFLISENISTKGTENEKGTGFGLILCKEFVEKLGGEIWVESEIGKGTTFFFTIPYKG